MTHEQRYSIFARDGFICQTCGKPVYNRQPQIAHRIKQGKQSVNFLLKEKKCLTVKQAEAILNHELNLVTTCSLKCNDSQNIFFKPVERDELIKQILKEVDTWNTK